MIPVIIGIIGLSAVTLLDTMDPDNREWAIATGICQTNYAFAGSGAFLLPGFFWDPLMMTPK